MPATPSARLRHLVLLAFQPDAPVAELLAAFQALPAAIADVQGFESGLNISRENLDQGYTHACLLSFADEAGRDRYLVHPTHLDFVQRLQGQVSQVLVVDYFAA